MEVATFLDNVDWEPVPVHRTARNIELIRCQPSKPVYGWLVSEQVTRMSVHWDGCQSTPHLKDPAKCPGCRQQLGLRQRGYLAILLAQEMKLRIVEITQDCIKHDVLLSNKNSHLRGRCVTIKRRPSKRTGKESKKSPVTAVWGPMPAPSVLPDDFDIRPTLGLIFGMIPDMYGNTHIAVAEGGAQ